VYVPLITLPHARADRRIHRPPAYTSPSTCRSRSCTRTLFYRHLTRALALEHLPLSSQAVNTAAAASHARLVLLVHRPCCIDLRVRTQDGEVDIDLPTRGQRHAVRPPSLLRALHADAHICLVKGHDADHRVARA
jgi:hypothetical protein